MEKHRLIRNLFKREAAGARPENSDRNDDHEHSEGDQSKHSCTSRTLEHEADDEAGNSPTGWASCGLVMRSRLVMSYSSS